MKALSNIRVLDLSRVLAGPYCTQMLGDLGAEIIKIEKPFAGDDTRLWGPPFLKDQNGNDTAESAYYLSINRNKKSVAIDMKSPEGQKLIKSLIAQSDIVIENFKVGGLKKMGLGYEQLKKDFPKLIYCAITGYGQNGPLADEPGYDFIAQGMAGLMTCTGGPDQPPIKAGVAISDILTGMNATIGILAALHAREKTGRGQMIDVALTDSTLAALTNIAQYYLTSGQNAPRVSNAHSTIVPYQDFMASDGHVIIAIGNNEQFKRFCAVLGQSQWASDAKFSTNALRVLNRNELVPMIAQIMKTQSAEYWITACRNANVPCGPVNTMDKVFAEDQIQARDMQISMQHAYGTVNLVGSPLKLSETPVSYDIAPPVCGQHTQEVLQNLLDLDTQTIAKLAQDKIIEIA